MSKESKKSCCGECLQIVRSVIGGAGTIYCANPECVCHGPKEVMGDWKKEFNETFCSKGTGSHDRETWYISLVEDLPEKIKSFIQKTIHQANQAERNRIEGVIERTRMADGTGSKFESEINSYNQALEDLKTKIKDDN